MLSESYRIHFEQAKQVYHFMKDVAMHDNRRILGGVNNATMKVGVFYLNVSVGDVDHNSLL